MSRTFERKRVVVTGIGTVTNYGDGVESFWEKL
jgi:3-oxoacyl-(acyl-carrier-protein) synthase